MWGPLPPSLSTSVDINIVHVKNVYCKLDGEGLRMKLVV